MEIGVISSYACIHTANNYGALLQYYALQEYLKSRGHRCYWIRSILPQGQIYLLLRNLKNYRNIVLVYDYYRCRKSFMKFLEHYLSVSNKIYQGNEDLVQNCPKADFFVSGSDQVWGGVIKENFLCFVPEKSRKIAYAASFGRSCLQQEQLNVITPWVRSFREVSVREKSGVDICKRMSVNAEHLLDPTFLIDREKYPLPSVRESYRKFLFCYFINVANFDDICWLKVKEYAESQGYDLQVSSCQYSERFFSKKYLRFLSPEQWLYSYRYAQCVITNTFHGTVFALIYHKPFVTILQQGITSEQNERLYSLLSVFHLENRILGNKSDSIAEIMQKRINWNNVDSMICVLRRKTDDFFAKVGL